MNTVRIITVNVNTQEHKITEHQGMQPTPAELYAHTIRTWHPSIPEGITQLYIAGLNAPTTHSDTIRNYGNYAEHCTIVTTTVNGFHYVTRATRKTTPTKEHKHESTPVRINPRAEDILHYAEKEHHNKKHGIVTNQRDTINYAANIRDYIATTHTNETEDAIIKHTQEEPTNAERRTIKIFNITRRDYPHTQALPHDTQHPTARDAYVTAMLITYPHAKRANLEMIADSWCYPRNYTHTRAGRTEITEFTFTAPSVRAHDEDHYVARITTEYHTNKKPLNDGTQPTTLERYAYEIIERLTKADELMKAGKHNEAQTEHNAANAIAKLHEKLTQTRKR